MTDARVGRRVGMALVASASLGIVGFFLAGGAATSEREQWLQGLIPPLWVAISVSFTGFVYWVLIEPGRALSRIAAARNGLYAGFLASSTLAGAVLSPFVVPLIVAHYWIAHFWSDGLGWFWEATLGGLELMAGSALIGALWGAGSRRAGTG